MAGGGFYGKAVTRGDFLSRRVPAGFAGVWDAWLQALMRAAQNDIGAYLTMPVWRFALGAEIAIAGPALGVLIPSVDRVGRYFPFTLLGFCQPGGMDPPAWLAHAESLVLTALEDNFDPETLDAALHALGPPAPLPTSAPPPLGWTSSQPAAAPAPTHTLWWRRQPEKLLHCQALPAGTDLQSLLDETSND